MVEAERREPSGVCNGLEFHHRTACIVSAKVECYRANDVLPMTLLNQDRPCFTEHNSFSDSEKVMVALSLPLNEQAFGATLNEFVPSTTPASERLRFSYQLAY
jgi:hypothetical protein